MKDKLIKILNGLLVEYNNTLHNNPNLIEGIDICASRIISIIQEHYFEFIEWIGNESIEFLTNDETEKREWILYERNSMVKYQVFETSGDLFNYWLKQKSKVSMTPVTSSQIKSIGYDSGTLYIEFLKGSVYTYSDVPKLCFKLMLKVENPGKYFSEYIKGKYDFIKTDKIVTNGEIK